MRNRILISSAAAVLAAGVLLGTAACDSSVNVGHGTTAGVDESGESGVSVESGTTYADHADAAADIRKGDLPAGLPAGATAIKRTAVDGTVYVSWKGAPIDDESCSLDADAAAPSMPGFVERKDAPERGVTKCDFGHQATGGSFTYFWTQQ